jgi:hypothetical protein
MILTILILTTLSHLGLYLWGRGDGVRVERQRLIAATPAVSVSDCYDNCKPGDVVAVRGEPGRRATVERIDVLHLSQQRAIHMTDGAIFFKSQGHRLRWVVAPEESQ